MILYFTGTGNSRYAASVIAEQTGDELVCMNTIIRQRITDPYAAQYAFKSEKPFVFVSPTYCWRVPRVVEEFILDSRFEGQRKAYFYLTCGDGTGPASIFAEELCRKAELEFMGLGSVKMPENYITMFKAPSYDEAQAIIHAATPSIEFAGRQIAYGKRLKDLNGKPKMKGVNTALNPAFYRLFVHDRKYFAKDDCTGCGLCEKLCPMADISLENGKPVWGGNCTQCMACIAACPQNAIEFGRRAKGKRRYYLLPNGTQKK